MYYKILLNAANKAKISTQKYKAGRRVFQLVHQDVHSRNNEKSSNSTIISQKHPDEHNRQIKIRNMNININRTALESSVTNTGWGGGLNRFYLLIFITKTIVRFNQKLPYLILVTSLAYIVFINSFFNKDPII